MKLKIKEWCSPLLLIAAVLSYILFTVPYQPVENSYTALFDKFVLWFSGYTWVAASLDIHFYFTLGTPVVLLALSLGYGVRALRDKELNRAAWLFSIVWITLSIGLLICGFYVLGAANGFWL